MIASGIFICLLLTFLSTLKRRVWLTVICFMVTLVFVLLLFKHHATDTLDISL